MRTARALVMRSGAVTPKLQGDVDKATGGAHDKFLEWMSTCLPPPPPREISVTAPPRPVTQQEIVSLSKVNQLECENKRLQAENKLLQTDNHHLHETVNEQFACGEDGCDKRFGVDQSLQTLSFSIPGQHCEVLGGYNLHFVSNQGIVIHSSQHSVQVTVEIKRATNMTEEGLKHLNTLGSVTQPVNSPPPEQNYLVYNVEHYCPS
ncbi:hypothetical protein Pelo_13484 [Pelomyxa schiedti]|nr:hypothetical protein Pelo_13484 [Pelomyxa schiedti]